MASLRVTGGRRQGDLIPLDKDAVILGRDPGCDIVLAGMSPCRQHARIERMNDQFYLVDLRSRGGTWLNDRPVCERQLLQEQDRIQICDFTAVFETGGATVAASP